ncbi:MAG: hypothetical protein IKP37_08315 [Paludibacteraceae bacterium]|nr:hypothetical protein [Paludibacteraceae bacterium]
MESVKNWYLKLRYGKIKTPYQHYVVILDGYADRELHDYESNVCPKGNAFMSFKVWAKDADEAAEIACSIASSIGFQVAKSNHTVFVYSTKPERPPKENPYAYDSKFFPYQD